MLDYRIHYAQLVIEDRLRRQRPTETTRPAARIHHRQAPRQVAATGQR